MAPRYCTLIALAGLTIYLGACAWTRDRAPISRINIAPIAAANAGHSDNPCRGFHLSAHEVADFFVYATPVDDAAEGERYYRMLPCVVNGTATINGERHDWIIRAGGVGEFYNDKERFIKICGKNCCDKVRSAC